MRAAIGWCFLLWGFVTHAQSAAGFAGSWYSPSEGITLSVYEEEDFYYGKITKATNPSLENRIVLVQMQPRSDYYLYGGTYYDSELKTEFEATLKLINPNTMRLRVIRRLSTKTIIWQRVK